MLKFNDKLSERSTPSCEIRLGPSFMNSDRNASASRVALKFSLPVAGSFGKRTPFQANSSFANRIASWLSLLRSHVGFDVYYCPFTWLVRNKTGNNAKLTAAAKPILARTY